MTTQAKVVIPREVADTIEYLRDDSGGCHAWSNEEIASMYASNGHYDSYQDEAGDLRKIPFDTLMRALLDGYERELTEDEKRERAYANIRELYADSYAAAHAIDYEDRSWDYGCIYAITFVLNALDVKIPGVNAPEETTHKEEHANV